MSAHPQLPWSRLTRWSGECYQRFGSIHKLPVRIIGAVTAELLKPDSRVLDIGAGVHHFFKQSLTQPGQKYFSLDIDPEGEFDFHSFDEMKEDVKFDFMVANQVLEHLTISETLNMLCSAENHLNATGYFLPLSPIWRTLYGIGRTLRMLRHGLSMICTVFFVMQVFTFMPWRVTTNMICYATHLSAISWM